MRAASFVSTSLIATASDLSFALARPTAPTAHGTVEVYAHDEADAIEVVARLTAAQVRAHVDQDHRRVVVVL